VRRRKAPATSSALEGDDPTFARECTDAIARIEALRAGRWKDVHGHWACSLTGWPQALSASKGSRIGLHNRITPAPNRLLRLLPAGHAPKKGALGREVDWRNASAVRRKWSDHRRLAGHALGAGRARSMAQQQSGAGRLVQPRFVPIRSIESGGPAGKPFAVTGAMRVGAPTFQPRTTCAHLWNRAGEPSGGGASGSATLQSRTDSADVPRWTTGAADFPTRPIPILAAGCSPSKQRGSPR